MFWNLASHFNWNVINGVKRVQFEIGQCGHEFIILLYPFSLSFFKLKWIFFHTVYSGYGCFTPNSSQIFPLLPIHPNPHPFLLSLIRKQQELKRKKLVSKKRWKQTNLNRTKQKTLCFVCFFFSFVLSFCPSYVSLFFIFRHSRVSQVGIQLIM